MYTLARRNKGFTHVELISVLSLIGVLSAVALPRLADVSSDARRATMQALAATLTDASVANFAIGQLRAAAEPVSRCQDAGRLLINATTQDDRLHWQGRVLALDAAAGGDVAPYLSCELRDSQHPAVGGVQFFLRACADRACRSG